MIESILMEIIQGAVNCVRGHASLTARVSLPSQKVPASISKDSSLPIGIIGS